LIWLLADLNVLVKENIEGKLEKQEDRLEGLKEELTENSEAEEDTNGN
jgi:hypothetical protein